MKKLFIILAVIAIIVIGFFIVRNGKKNEKPSTPTVKSTEVKKGEIQVKLEETGEIQPIREIEIKSEISGRVVRFFVKEGNLIQKGDLIAEIEPDYNQTKTISDVQSTLKLAKIRLENAKENYQNKQKLFENNYIPKSEFDEADDRLEEAKINYTSAQQQYESIRDIETDGSGNRVISSATGTIIQQLVEEGEKVVSSSGNFSEGTTIVKLADLSQMIVESSINEVDISKIHIGQTVNIQVDAYPYEKYSGEITEIAAMAILENSVKVFPFEIKISNSDKRLRPGMTANITILGEEKSDILVIPIRTIFSDEDNQDIVYLVKNDTISTSQVIKTGINDFQKVEIIDGVNEGDRVSFSEPKNNQQSEKGKPGW